MPQVLEAALGPEHMGGEWPQSPRPHPVGALQVRAPERPQPEPCSWAPSCICPHPQSNVPTETARTSPAVCGRGGRPGLPLGLQGATVRPSSSAVSTSWALTQSRVTLALCSHPHGGWEGCFIRETETVLLGALRHGAHSHQGLDRSRLSPTVRPAAFPWALHLHRFPPPPPLWGMGDGSILPPAAPPEHGSWLPALCPSSDLERMGSSQGPRPRWLQGRGWRATRPQQ